MKSEAQIRAMRIMIATRFKCEALDDNGIYIYRFSVPSTSNLTHRYVVSFNRRERHWGCACTGWVNHRHCKHLDKMHSALKTAFEVG